MLDTNESREGEARKDRFISERGQTGKQIQQADQPTRGGKACYE